MNNTYTSWYPVRNFTKQPHHRDWTMGPTKIGWAKDAVTGRPINKFETVMWNRTKNNATVALETYKQVISEGNPEMIQKLVDLELPLDIKL